MSGRTVRLELPPLFDDVMRRYEREIMRFLFRSAGDRDDAMDLFQETWLRAYRAWPKLESADGVRPWLYRIASNLCRNRLRDRARRLRIIAASNGEVDSASAPAADESLVHFKRVIARLPPKQGQALMMRKFGGFEYGEIAAVLECSAESARANVYQALRKLEASR